MPVRAATFELGAVEAERHWQEPDDEAGWEEVDIGWKEAGWQAGPGTAAELHASSDTAAEHHDDHHDDDHDDDHSVELDANGYDKHGGYYDEEGGYYDADGGYYDQAGTFFEPEPEGFEVPTTPTEATAGSSAASTLRGPNPFSKILKSP